MQHCSFGYVSAIVVIHVSIWSPEYTKESSSLVCQYKCSFFRWMACCQFPFFSLCFFFPEAARDDSMHDKCVFRLVLLVTVIGVGPEFHSLYVPDCRAPHAKYMYGCPSLFLRIVCLKVAAATADQHFMNIFFHL
ncbi:hypothetical protein Droror1_Dr00011821 [Drosera rotundifolia]